MKWEHLMAKAFCMSEDVWTRYGALPLLVVALWSRIWIGWWSLIPILVVSLWLWLNPRAFPPPVSTNNWASKSVMGECVWLKRREVPIPETQKKFIQGLEVVMIVGSLILGYGLVVLNGPVTCIGLVVVVFSKTWFFDRMVWLFEEVIKEHPPFRIWLY